MLIFFLNQPLIHLHVHGSVHESWGGSCWCIFLSKFYVGSPKRLSHIFAAHFSPVNKTQPTSPHKRVAVGSHHVVQIQVKDGFRHQFPRSKYRITPCHWVPRSWLPGTNSGRPWSWEEVLVFKVRCFFEIVCWEIKTRIFSDFNFNHLFLYFEMRVDMYVYMYIYFSC